MGPWEIALLPASLPGLSLLAERRGHLESSDPSLTVERWAQCPQPAWSVPNAVSGHEDRGQGLRSSVH